MSVLCQTVTGEESTFKNKYQSQHIHKKFNNKHRRSAWKSFLNPKQRVYATKTQRVSRQAPADLNHIIRACRGVSVRDVIEVVTSPTESFDDDDVSYYTPIPPAEEHIESKIAEVTGVSFGEVGGDMLDWEWACQSCTYINWPDSLQCEICGDLNPYTVCAMTEASELVAQPPQPTSIWRQTSDETRMVSLKPVQPARKTELALLCVEYLDTMTSARPVDAVHSKRTSSLDQRYGPKMRKNLRTASRKAFSDWKSACKTRTEGKKPTLNKRKLENRLYPQRVRKYISKSLDSKFPGYEVHPLVVPDRLRSAVTKGVSKFELAFHGSDSKNLSSIAQKGLLVGGQGCARAHGAVYGTGVYCSPDASLARSYAGGSQSTIFACAVLKARKAAGGRIWVAPTANDILPCFVVTKPSEGNCSRYLYLRVVNHRRHRWVTADNDLAANELLSRRRLYEMLYGVSWMQSGGFRVVREASGSKYSGMSYHGVMRTIPKGILNNKDRNRRSKRGWQ